MFFFFFIPYCWRTRSKCWLRKRSFWWSILQDFFFFSYVRFSFFLNFQIFSPLVFYIKMSTFIENVLSFPFFFLNPYYLGTLSKYWLRKRKFLRVHFLRFFIILFFHVYIYFSFFFSISSEFLIFSLYIIVYIKIIKFFKVKLLKKKVFFFFWYHIVGGHGASVD